MTNEPKYLPALIDPGLRTEAQRRRRSYNNVSPHPEWPEPVERTYFFAWMAANRAVPAAKRLLVEQWGTYAPPDAPPEFLDVPLPTLYKWVKVHNWNARANDWIASTFPETTMHQNARLIGMGDKVQDEMAAILNGERDHLPRAALDARVKVIDMWNVARGIGTHGSVLRQAPVIRQHVDNTAIDVSSMTEQELAELQQGIIRDGKTRNNQDVRQ